jgi:hypothetical protein
MQHLDGSGAWPSYIQDARFLKVNNSLRVQVNVTVYKGKPEIYSLLECDAVRSGGNFPTFRTN